MNGFEHISVLREALVESLALRVGDIAVDCTAGGGGHTVGLLAAVGPNGKVIALDRDQRAIEVLSSKFAAESSTGRLTIVKTKFSEIRAVAEKLGVNGAVRGICADIGVSSPQLDEAERGFSFMKDGPLDMRMDTSPGIPSAADLVNTAGESELLRIFRDFGEEPKARYIARAIVAERAVSPIRTTARLAQIVKDAVFYKEASRKHPATKVFQALRVAVNDELGELTTLIEDGFAALQPSGRLAIITFHSLEDRLVKAAFQKLTGKERRAQIPRNLPLTGAEVTRLTGAEGVIIKPFPLVPSEGEINGNPRSRSAKLRVIQKISSDP